MLKSYLSDIFFDISKRLSPVKQEQPENTTAPARREDPLPDSWINSLYPPGWPISPMARDADELVPREIDYPMSVNASLTPRTGYGHMPFSSLAQSYEAVSEVKQCVTTILREMSSYRPRLVSTKDGTTIVKDHPYSWILTSPDKDVPFTVWAARLLQSQLIFDAGSLYISRSGSNLDGLHYVDGSTIFAIVDQNGRTPNPDAKDETPAGLQRKQERFTKYLQNERNRGKPTPTTTPAYAQVIKGTPYNWYDKNQIWYRPRFRRYNSPYGMPGQEAAWPWVIVLANITAFELAFYREGNLPEGIFSAPEHWSLRQIDLYEEGLNARMSSGPAERRRARVFPHGMRWYETKRHEFPSKLYNQARDALAHDYGIPPSEFGTMPSSGLGSRGFADLVTTQVYRTAISPNKAYIEDAINDALLMFGVTDVKAQLYVETATIDPQQRQDSATTLFASGIITLNDALSILGRTPVEGGDVRVVIQNGQVLIVDDILTGKNQLPSAGPEQGIPDPENQNSDPGTINPEDSAKAKEILDTGKLTDGKKTVSLPPKKDGTRQVPKVEDSAAAKKQEVKKSMEVLPVITGSAMVCLKLPKGYSELLTTLDFSGVPGFKVNSADEMHVTLAYLGDLADASYSRETALALIRVFAASRHFLIGKTGGIARFAPKDGKSPLVMLLDSPDLPFFRDALVRTLETGGVVPGLDHGFIPHVTLGYAPDGPEMVTVPVSAFTFSDVYLVWGDDWIPVPLLTSTTGISKHCGVCEEDDFYYGSAVVRSPDLDTELVVMAGEDLLPQQAIWEPEGDEQDSIVDWIGGPQYPRREAVYLLDRSFGFFLTPVSYVSQVLDEVGSVTYEFPDLAGPKPAEDYSPEWIVKAGILDFVSGQLSRQSWTTHPDDSSRVILTENGVSFPVLNRDVSSPFYDLSLVALSLMTKDSLLSVMKAVSIREHLWRDIQTLVGTDASNGARVRLDDLITRLSEKA